MSRSLERHGASGVTPGSAHEESSALVLGFRERVRLELVLFRTLTTERSVRSDPQIDMDRINR